MSCSTEMQHNPTGYVGVVRLVNFYIATHVSGSQKTFISKHPEVDIKTAQATAKFFADAQEIPYKDGLFELDRPIITVLKHEQNWFPAELYVDRIRLLTAFGPINLGGNQQEATNMANVIALSKGADCIPSIGISLEK